MDFFCPECKKSVYDGERDKLKLKAIFECDHFHATSLMELNPQKGKFGGKVLSDNVFFEDGAVVKFRCPHCNFDFTLDFDDRFFKLGHEDEKGEKHNFILNRTSGKEMAFVISEKDGEVLESYGKHQSEYMKDFHQYMVSSKFNR
ncbi:MAG: hypothetical protein R6W70_02770 [bacterium]